MECMHNDNLFNIHDSERRIIVLSKRYNLQQVMTSLLISSVRSTCL